MGNLNRLVAGRTVPVVVSTQRQLLSRGKRIDIESGVTAVLSPASYGSFGDEGMMQGSRDSILAAHGRPELFTPGDGESWSEMGVDGVASFDGVIAVGGMHVDARKFALLTSAARVVVLGADSIDGAYGIRSIAQRVSLLNVAVAQGRSAELANFSFRKHASQDALAALRHLDPRVRLTARDRNSQKRIVAALRREVGVFPDVAAYMQPSSTSAVEELSDWIVSRGRPTAVLVPNTHLAAFNGTGHEEVRRRFASYVSALVGAGFAVVVLAHDIREEPGDVALSHELVAGADPRTCRVAVPRNAQEAKGMLGAASVVVTARMHAGVAALSQGIPCVGLDYVDKFTGQFEWYGADRYVVAWEDKPSPDHVTGLAQQAFEAAAVREMSTPAFVNAPPSWLL
ncbi:polysaccharide pyruvyl transferase family protein [Arthrobacter sp. RAF14]|uniref:polysaccharide pyruvyl transferase family protein n=1 Tax=Arthrobacter sp. RAF14 TaxID=3233051 RepID=UPI003F90003F